MPSEIERRIVDAKFEELMTDSASIANSALSLLLNRTLDLDINPYIALMMLKFVVSENIEKLFEIHEFPSDLAIILQEIDPDKEPVEVLEWLLKCWCQTKEQQF